MTVKMVLLDYFLAASYALVPSVSADILPRQQNETLDSCPGYKASGVETTGNGLTATLTLAGTACNVYGTDLEELTLTVEYQSGKFSSFTYKI
jgi:alpha-glucosidase